ncbi:MAG TPA: hypothetical protein VKG79_11860 [Bryobacteraceae bacterium]|nr:hypothetical protein [Bryobacteraceae bacterium]
MSYDLQAEGLNGVNIQTSVVAGHDWNPNLEEGLGSPVSTVLFVSGTAPDIATPFDTDATTGRGNLRGNGVTGWGGNQRGSGIVGIAGSAMPQPPSDPGTIRDKNVGVYGLGGDAGVFGQGSSGNPGVVGQGDVGSPGVVGQAGTGDADGVRGFAAGDFSGVAGFGDPSGNGTGVYGQGNGRFAQGVRGIGGHGPNSSPIDPAGVYGQGGAGNAYGVEGRGSGQFAGVAGFGAASENSSPVSPAGVYGQAGAGNANGVEGRGSGNFAGVAGFGDASNTANSGIGVFAVGGAPQPASGHFGGPGVYAIGNGGPGYTQLNQSVGVYGIGGAGDAPGVLGQGGSTAAAGVQGSSGSGFGVSGQSGSGVGVMAFSNSATGLVAQGTIGLIASTTAGGGTAGQFDGNVVIGGQLTVHGAKSVAVPFPDGSHRKLYCVESPENWFEDFGFGELSNGEAQVQLEEGFRSVVNSDAYHVFITEYEDNNALYVAERTSAGFLVRAKASKANGTFSYRVVAKRRDIAAPRFDKVQLQSDREGPARAFTP